MIRWSASASDRAVRCPASLSLPAVRDAGGADAAWGTDVHAFLEDAVRTSPASARGRAGGPSAGCCAAIAVHDILEELAGGEGIAEILPEEPILYLPEAGGAEPLRLGGPRAYPSAAYQRGIPGTADLVLVTREGTVVVADYKTGAVPPRAASSWQLRVLGLGAARLFGAARVRLAIVAIDREGGHRVDAVDFPEADQAEARAALAEAWAAARDAEASILLGEAPSVQQGEHCGYCPALRACPASTALVRDMAAGGLEGVAGRVADLSPAEAGAAWQKAKLARRLLDTIEDALRERLRRDGSIPLPGGDTLTTTRVATRSIDGRRALPVLESHGLAPRLGLTMGDVADAVQSSGGGAEDLARVIKELDECGAIRTSTADRAVVQKRRSMSTRNHAK